MHVHIPVFLSKIEDDLIHCGICDPNNQSLSHSIVLQHRVGWEAFPLDSIPELTMPVCALSLDGFDVAVLAVISFVECHLQRFSSFPVRQLRT